MSESVLNCVVCNYECNDQEQFDEHIKTHVYGKAKMINGVLVQWTTYNCTCGKQYKHRSGLSRHVKSKHNTQTDNT